MERERLRGVEGGKEEEYGAAAPEIAELKGRSWHWKSVKKKRIIHCRPQGSASTSGSSIEWRN